MVRASAWCLFLGAVLGCSAGSNIVGGVVDAGSAPDTASDLPADSAADAAPDAAPEAAFDTSAEPALDTAPEVTPDATEEAAPDTTVTDAPRDVPGEELTGCAALGCPGGGLCCAGECVDAQTSVAHCGTCGNGCALGQFCHGGRCVRDNGPCMTNNDCGNDSRCQVSLRRCITYNTAEVSPVCTREVRAGVFNPVVQCRFDAAPMGDPYPEYTHVLSTPMVADLRVYRSSPSDPVRPSIIAVFDDGGDGSSENPNGLLRILDGRNCALLENVDEERVSHSSPPAVADLDGDGVPELVAFKAGGGLVAFRYGPAVAMDGGVEDVVADGSDGGDTRSRWRVWWRSRSRDGSEALDPSGGGWAGPSITDVDGDGRPEVLRFGLVFHGQTGLLLGGESQHATLRDHSQGTFPVVADVDEDGAAELVTGHGVFAWDAARQDWVLEPYFRDDACASGACVSGHVALANFGPYPLAAPDGGVTDAEPDAADEGGTDAASPSVTDPGLPEVVVVSVGAVRVQTLDGRVVFGPVSIPGGGTGGPPTVADFDGDGLPEVATAASTRYTVFDPDCEESPRRPGGRCASGSTDGILWSSMTQDSTSNITGSTSFDFEGDGRVEAVYADECFVRVYDGRTGSVLASLQHSSCTWYENPVVADVDGDFRAEIVASSNFNCGSPTAGISCADVDARDTDPRFAGLRCTRAADCPSRLCADGFCRCTEDAQCCRARGIECTHVCAPPPPGTPGTGNTCRTSRPSGVHGLRVYADIADNWVRSRTIWNQHAYNVTNVTDTAGIPRTRDVRRNWRDPALNNYRTNVQGVPETAAAPDVTVEGERAECLPRGVLLTARACNRGTAPLTDGIFVGFYDRDPMAGGTRLCQVPTPRALAPGECLRVTCPWPEAPRTSGASPSAFVRGDDENEITECLEGNNTGITLGAVCVPGDAGVAVDASTEASVDVVRDGPEGGELDR